MAKAVSKKPSIFDIYEGEAARIRQALLSKVGRIVPLPTVAQVQVVVSAVLPHLTQKFSYSWMAPDEHAWLAEDKSNMEPEDILSSLGHRAVLHLTANSRR